ncbi:putative amidohydrolase YtcJ [Trichoplax sp. H2]|nr:putative amidohydrolase YtcJ [Trichoplax sp. H2]|eukprot:RDD40109.1 putative amidohydrolase YtcJ [Trichoplax sp. H2]
MSNVSKSPKDYHSDDLNDRHGEKDRKQFNETVLSQRAQKATPLESSNAEELPVVIYTAKKIYTMNCLQPEATAIAVQGDRIFAVGSEDSIVTGLKAREQSYQIKRDYKDCFFYPGFIESHCHASLEALYFQFHYVGATDRIKCVNGTMVEMKGFNSKQKVLDHLQQVSEASHENIIVAWGYDPTLLLNEASPNIHASEIDFQEGKKVVVMNMSGHIAYINHAVLTEIGYTDKTDMKGVIKDEDGHLTGELQEMTAMAPLFGYYDVDLDDLVRGFRSFATVASSKGVTTLTDLAFGIVNHTWAALQQVTQENNCPVKVNCYMLNGVYDRRGGADGFRALKQSENPKLKLTGVKIISDGSIQGFTGLMRWPYYYTSRDQGLANITPIALDQTVRELVSNDIPCAIHTNGDGSIEMVLDSIERVTRFTPDRDPRFRLEHCQTPTEDHLERMKRYNINANFFVNHIYYWGNVHKNQTIGPDRVEYMNPCATAKKLGITFALHSDSPITAIDPLLMVQNAVVRQTKEGNVIGENERICVYDALRAVTKDAAYLLREERIKGTLAFGKLADIAILEKDVFQVDKEDIHKIVVRATLVNGRVFDHRS